MVYSKILNKVKKELSLTRKELEKVKRVVLDYSVENGVVITTQLVKAVAFKLGLVKEPSL